MGKRLIGQNYYLISAFFVIIALTSGCAIKTGPLLQNILFINDDNYQNTPASSLMDVQLFVSEFSDDKTSEITVRLGKREGLVQNTTWNDVKAEIRLPENLELVEGSLNWQGDIPINEFREFKIKVKAVKKGEGIVQAVARYTISEDAWFGDGEVFYVLVKDDEVLISDKPFTPSPREKGEREYAVPIAVDEIGS